MAKAKAKRSFVRLPEVTRRVGYRRPSIYRLMAQGQFPRPFNLGARAVAWLESDIDDWIDSRINSRPALGTQEAA